MIVATIVTYNDYPLIKDCIESIINKVDRIIVIDGKYRDFPGELECSDDGTIEYLTSIDTDKITIRYVQRLDEVAKRNIYLQYLKDDDVCLNIDADEVLITPLPQLDKDIGLVRIGLDGDRRRLRRTIRYFRYRVGLHYYGQHKLILDKDNKMFAWLDQVGNYTVQDDGVEFLHNSHKRPQDRIKNKKKYYDILMKREAKINVSVN